METPPPTAPPALSYEQSPPEDVDTQHLKLLSIFYYIMAGLLMLFGGGFGLLYLIIGIAMMASPSTIQDPNAPQNMGLFVGGVLGGVGAFVLIFGVTVGILQILCGNNLRRARKRTFCFVVAGVTCIASVPLGTVLGVFTFVVLSRESVRERFLETAASAGDASRYR